MAQAEIPPARTNSRQVAYIPRLREMKPGSRTRDSGAGKSKDRDNVSGLLKSQPETDMVAQFCPGLVWSAAVLVWFGAPAQPQGRAKVTFFPQIADQALMG